MKDSSVKSLEQQALQVQADQLLPIVTRELSKLDYQKITHKRLSQQTNNTVIYQGLTRAHYLQFGSVMIKWQLSLSMYHHSSDLYHEAQVLHTLQQHQNNLTAIAPSVLTYEILHLKVLRKQQTLTLLVMPYYAQGSLAKYLTQPLTVAQKHQLIVQVAQLIAHLHQAGWIHGDIKPSNFLLSDDQLINTNNLTLRLTDFALAKPINLNRSIYKPSLIDSAGTPAYLAPECWQGQGITMQSDIYAFGIMLYEILVGRRPFAIDAQSDEPLRDWATQHCQQPIPTLPIQYSQYQLIVDKAIEKRVEKRYLSMEELTKDLRYL